MDPIETSPAVADFTLLSEHQEQTPGTFFGGKAVLHLHAPNATIKVPSDQFEAQPDLKKLAGDAATTTEDGQLQFPGVDVWVTSKQFMLFAPSQSFGLQISYPTITVTAQDKSDVLLELNLSDADTADDDIVFLQLRIEPTSVERHADDAQEQAGAGATNGTTPQNDAATALFKAISDCQELNPDPVGMGEEGEDGEEGFDETAPGATGWITSENMADFMDADGNFKMPEGMTVIGGEEEAGEEETLGEGAGRTRTAAEALEEEETKWRRTS